MTNIYVDGFNLYYGALKGTPYKWLDLDMLSRLLVPGREIKRIRYFTAPVTGRRTTHRLPSGSRSTFEHSRPFRT